MSDQLMTADAPAPGTFDPVPMWGVYLDGAPAIIPDSIKSVDYKQDYRVADYPMEQGAFESYNKVATPFDFRVTMTKGGNDSDRADFLQQVEDASKSLNLYSIVTPEWIYGSANIVHMDYRRNSTNGVSLLTVDLWFLEIRVTATAAFSNTKEISGASPVQGGQVQPKAPTTQEEQFTPKAT